MGVVARPSVRGRNVAEVTARVWTYRDGVPGADTQGTETALDDVGSALASGMVVWIDITDADAAQLEAVSACLGLHELAVEDVLGEHQRPKLDHYGTHMFLVTHAVHVDRERKQLVRSEIDAFVGERWLVTVRKPSDDHDHPAPSVDMEAARQRAARSVDLARHGVSFLLYGILDLVVDGYFNAIEAFDEFFEDLSEQIFSGKPLNATEQRAWFMMRQALVRFHRLAVPMREAVSALMRHENRTVPEELYPYFQDVYDHILRVSESTEALRDLVSTIVETNLSLRDYRQNQSMKMVTSWAAIIAVQTLVTGFYGMNVPYPGAGRTSGVVAAIVLIVVLSGSLYVAFRKRDWL